MPNQWLADQARGCPDRHNNFGLARLYLAFGVFVGHYSWIFPDGPIPDHLTQWLVGEAGLNAVRAFFIISGYFLFRSFRTSKTVYSYIGKRANRVLPAYVSVVLAVAVLGIFLTNLSAADYLSPDLFKYVFWNLLFLNFIHPTLPGVFEAQPVHLVNSPLWTLKIEISFYLAVPIIATAARWVRLPVILAILYMGSLAYAHVFDHLFQSSGRPIFHTLSLQMPGQLCYFLSGALIEYYREQFRIYGKALTIGAAVTILLSGLLSIDVFYPISFGIIVIAFCTLLPYLGNWEKYGDFSYSIYIFHFPILQVFCGLGLLDAYPPLRFMVIVAIVLAISYLSWTFIESPFLRRRSATAILTGDGASKMYASPSTSRTEHPIPEL